MYKYLLIVFTSIALNVCKAQGSQQAPLLKVETFFATAETDPVSSAEDAADDIAIWENPNNVEQSIVVGTNKKGGLETYDLNGNRRYKYSFGKMNNVDLRLPRKPEELPLLAASNRSDQTVFLGNLLQDGQIIPLETKLNTQLKDVYGLCFYDGEIQTYLFVSDKKGRIQQWQLFQTKNGWQGVLIRTLKFSSTVEGLVADSIAHKLYVAQEDKGLWEINVFPWHPLGKTLLLKTNNTHLRADFEGLALLARSQDKRYVFLSVQGNNTYGVLDLQRKKLIKQFKIAPSNGVDGTSETDGIDINLLSSSLFPRGILVVQDGDNQEQNQNFKYISLEALQL